MITTCGVAKCSYHRIDKYAVTLVALKDELMRNGYIATAHAMEGAVKAIGWELAERITKLKKRKAKK